MRMLNLLALPAAIVLALTGCDACDENLGEIPFPSAELHYGDQVTPPLDRLEVALGASLVGALFGRKLASATNVRRIGTAARSAGRIGKERSDIGRAKENLEAAQQQLEDMEEELQSELAALEDAIDPLTEELDEIQIRPKKTNIDVRLLTLCWLPYWVQPDGSRRAAWDA